MRALADVGRDLRLGEYVRLGRGEETTGGRDKTSILADTLEAVLGAVYIDQRPAGGRRPGAPALRPADRAGRDARRRPGLEDQPAGAHRERLDGRPRVRRQRDRPGPPEALHRRRAGRRRRLRPGPGPQQEGGRAGGRGDRLAPAARRADDGTDELPAPTTDGRARGPHCPSCPRSRSSGAGSTAGSRAVPWPPSRSVTREPSAGTSRRRGLRGPARRPHLAGAQRRGKYLWLACPRVTGAPGDGSGGRGGAGPPRHERPAAGPAGGRPRRGAPAGAPVLHRRRAPSCASSTSGRSAGWRSSTPTRRAAAAGRAHRP